jgi:uroporphyrinogen decarboxylase
MTSKQRMLTALQRGIPDRLPVTTHHVMPYFLDTYLDGIDIQAFFELFGMDAITWAIMQKPNQNRGEYLDPTQGEPGFLEPRRVISDQWRIGVDVISGQEYPTVCYTFSTPDGSLSMVLASNEHTSWVVEHLVKEKSDIEIIQKHITHPLADVEAVNSLVEQYGERGLVRSHIPCFDVFGQPGTWQDACCLFGTENLILEAYDDPSWVHQFLSILQDRKITYIRSLTGARYDLIELGGGSASTTVISPGLFEKFVAPYDAPLIKLAHEAGQRIVYHTCGGMMPILEMVADMKPDAMETFTPPEMGADVDLAQAKRRIGGRVCMIGGFDQFHYLVGCSEQETRAAVRQCFESAGEGGGYILSPSDHFFDAESILLHAYADEARRCVYEG